MITDENLQRISFLQSHSQEVYLSVLDLYIKNFENIGIDDSHEADTEHLASSDSASKGASSLSSSLTSSLSSSNSSTTSNPSQSEYFPRSSTLSNSQHSHHSIQSLESLHDASIAESTLYDLIIHVIIVPMDTLNLCNAVDSGSFPSSFTNSSNDSSRPISIKDIGENSKKEWVSSPNSKKERKNNHDSSTNTGKMKGFLHSILGVRSKLEDSSEVRFNFQQNFVLTNKIREKYARRVHALVDSFIEKGFIQPMISSSKSSYLLKLIPKACNHTLSKNTNLINPYILSLASLLDPNSILLAFLQDPKFIYFVGLQNEINFLAHVAYYKVKGKELDSSESYKRLENFLKMEARAIYKSRVKTKFSERYSLFGKSPSIRLVMQANSIKTGDDDISHVVSIFTPEQRQSIKAFYKKPTLDLFDDLFYVALDFAERKISQHIEGEDHTFNEIFSLQYYVEKYLIDNTSSVIQLYEQLKLPMLRALRKHLKSEYSLETLIFYEHALAYQNELDIWIRKTRLQHIYFHFLSETAPMPLNISALATKHCRTMYSNGNFAPDSLTPATVEVLRDLNQNFQRYLSIGEFASSVLFEIRNQFNQADTIYTPDFVKLCLAGREFSLNSSNRDLKSSH